MTNFLLIYDRAARRLIAQTEFPDAEDATRAYDAAELEHLGDDDVEIVLVGADSLETIKRTHGQYFESQPAGRPDRSWTASAVIGRFVRGSGAA